MQDEVEVKARELLAAEIRRGQSFDAFLGPVVASEAAIRAIAAALRQRPVVDNARMARALEWLRNVVALGFPVTSPEHLPAIEEAIAAYQQDNGGK